MGDQELGMQDRAERGKPTNRSRWWLVGAALSVLIVAVLAWPIAIQTWADENGPCSLNGSPEGSSVESRGWSWASFSYS